MIPERDWKPSRELLAAYADGEFEGRDDLADLQRRLEQWLSEDAGARAELAEYRRLRQLWLETTPAEPTAAAWDSTLDEVLRARQTPVAPAPTSWPRRLAVTLAVAASLALVFIAWQPGAHTPAPGRTGEVAEDDEVFPVATASEVAILTVEGPDAATLVVGELPLQGPLELAGPGDVTLTSVEPDARDNMIPQFVSTGRPMIWARLETD